MALTRPSFTQLTTTTTAFNDPITVLNQGSASANVDVGFLFNRANGLVSNVALYWSEATQSFVTAYTSATGITNTNVAVTSYANVRTGNITANGFFWSNGAVFSSGSTFTGGYVQNTIIAAANLVANSGTASSSNVTGAVVVSGGIGVSGSVNVGSSLVFSNTSNPGISKPLVTRLDLNNAGGLDSNGPFWSGYHFNAPDGIVVNGLTGYPRMAFYWNYNSVTNPNNINFNMVAGNNATGGNANVSLGTDTAGYVRFLTNNAERLKIGGEGNVVVTSTTASSSTTTGALVVAGGAGIAGTLYIANTGDVSANIGSLLANAGSQATSIVTINANLGTATTNITTLFSNAAGQANQITGANAAIVTANSAVVSFIGTVNNNLSTAITANTNAANAAIITANSAVVSFIGMVNSNLSTAITANTNAANTAATTANTNMKSYVDTQDSAITTAWTSNAATQATSINTINANIGSFYQYANANLGTATTNITTLFSNAATQATSINSINANLGTATTNITNLQSNAGTQQSQINSIVTNANANVAAYLPTYSGSLGGTLTTAAQTNITSVGTLTGLTSSGIVNITNSTQSNDTTTGALVVTGGAAVGANLHVGGSLHITGNLEVNGTQTIFNTNVSVIEDSMIYLGDDNTGDSVDIGLVSSFTNPAYQHTGFVRDASDGVWKLFANVVAEPTTIVDFTSATYSPLRIGALTATSGTYSGSIIASTVSAGTIGNAGATLTGTLSSGAQNNITSATGITALGTITSLAATTAVATNFSSGNIVFTNATSGTVSTANVSLYESVTATTTNATHYPMLSGTATGNTASFTSSSLVYNPSTGNLVVAGTTASTSTTTGALVVAGGAAIAGNLNVGGVFNTFSGNVGIGNTAPVSKLHVQGATSGDGGSFNGTGSALYVKQDTTWSGNQPWALYVSGYSYLNGFRINASDGIRALYKTSAGGSLGFATTGDDPITFTQSDSLERMRIAVGGNVVVTGTTTSTSSTTGALVVKGGVGVAGQMTVASNISLSESGGSGTRTVLSSSGSGAIINHNDNSDVFLQTQGNTRIQILNGSGIVSFPYGITANSSGIRSTFANIITTNGVYWANGAAYSSGGSFTGGYVASQSTFGANLVANSATNSTSNVTGAVVVAGAGGLGVGGNVYVGNRVGYVWGANSVSSAYTYFNSVTNSIDTVFG